MSKILLIETSTSLCSVALASFGADDSGKIIAERRSGKPRQHASLTAVFIDEVLREAGIAAKDLSAVALSAGPGSYTGLRVGSSTAKGICFGAGVPLISVGTLDVLAWQGLALLPAGCSRIIPMIDARRMEVYAACYELRNGVPVRLTEVAPIVIDENSFADFFAQGPVCLIGDGAGKCDFLPAVGNIQCCPEASAMLQPALAAFRAEKFEDIAYFEPFYLKDFVVTVGKKLF